MKLARFASVAACVAGVSFVAPAFASSKKASTKAPGTLVAMSGSGSMGSSSGSDAAYIGIRMLPFEITSTSEKQGSTTTDTPATKLRTLPKEFDFYARLGSWVVRPTLNLGVTAIEGNGQVISVEDNTSYLAAGYMLAPNLEVGGLLSLARDTSENGDKVKSTESNLLIGPYGVYFTEFAGLPVEAEGKLFLVFVSGEATKDNKTETTADASGFGFEVAATAVKEVASSLEYVGGIRMGYTKLTAKSRTVAGQKIEEASNSEFAFTIVPAGLRFKF